MQILLNGKEYKYKALTSIIFTDVLLKRMPWEGESHPIYLEVCSTYLHETNGCIGLPD